MRESVRRAAVAATLGLSILCARTAGATARQIHGGPLLGYALSTGAGAGPDGAHAGSLGGHVGYGIDDAWRWYAHLEYDLGAGTRANTAPMHAGALTTGFAYGLDVVSTVPWLGLGVGAVVAGSAAWLAAFPVVEVRGGVDFLTSRYFGLTLQVAYAIPVLNRELLENRVTVAFGMRFTADL